MISSRGMFPRAPLASVTEPQRRRHGAASWEGDRGDASRIPPEFPTNIVDLLLAASAKLNVSLARIDRPDYKGGIGRPHLFTPDSLLRGWTCPAVRQVLQRNPAARGAAFQSYCHGNRLSRHCNDKIPVRFVAVEVAADRFERHAQVAAVAFSPSAGRREGRNSRSADEGNTVDSLRKLSGKR